jgi:hypothetical protein
LELASGVAVGASGRGYAAGGVADTADSSPELDVAATVAAMWPPSGDDVPIALDGTLLDTPIKLIAYPHGTDTARETGGGRPSHP